MFEERALSYAEWQARGTERLGLTDAGFQRSYPEEMFWRIWEESIEDTAEVIGDFDVDMVRERWFSECAGCGGSSHLTRDEQLAALHAIDSISLVDRSAADKGELRLVPKFGVTRDMAQEVGMIVDKTGSTNLARCEVIKALPEGVEVTV